MALELATPLETICRLIIRGREMEAQVPDIDPDNEDRPDDADDEFAVMDDEVNETVEVEMRSLLEDLADDQVQEVLALALVGRGTYDASEWDDALEASDDSAARNVEQLLEMAMLSGYLDAGLAAFDLNCDGIGQID